MNMEISHDILSELVFRYVQGHTSKLTAATVRFVCDHKKHTVKAVVELKEAEDGDDRGDKDSERGG